MQIKNIDWNQRLYHLFKLTNVVYALYDDLMDMPIKYGSLNNVDPVITSLRKYIKDIHVIYYDRDLQDKISFKKNQLKTRVNNDKSKTATLPEGQIRIT